MSIADHNPASDSIEGYLDQFTETGELRGWARDRAHDDRRVLVDVYIGAARLFQTTADLFRADVKGAGIGDGCYGFSINVPEPVIELAREEGQTLRVVASGRELGSVRLSRTVEELLPNAKTLLLAPLQSASLRAAYSKKQEGLEGQARAPGPISSGALVRLFAAPNQGNASSPLSPYLEFIRSRLRVDTQFEPQQYRSDIDDYYRWYLDHYSVMRKPLRVPFSAAEIAYLNEPVVIANSRFPISRITLSYALDTERTRSLLVPNDEAAYRKLLYWWCTELSNHLNVEDCLVPNYYSDYLSSVSPTRRYDEFPFSVFLDEYHGQESRLSSLKPALSTQDRATVYMLVLLENLGMPGVVRYLPTKGLQSLAKRFDRFSVKVADSPGGVRALNYDQLVSLYRDAGFDLASRTFLTRDGAGNRSESLRFKRPEAPKSIDLQIIGPFGKASGLGQACRLSAEAVKRTGLSFNFVDFDLEDPAPEFKGESTGAPSKSKINLIHLNAESIPLAYAYAPDVFTGAYNIGYFFWELSSPALPHHLALDMLDEVWVSTEYGLEVYASATEKPVVNVGMTYQEVPSIKRGDARETLLQYTGFADDDFVLFSTFDSFSFVQRKNPLGLIKAFRAAFPDDPRVKLLLKTHNRDYVSQPKQQKIWRAIMDAVQADSRIVLMNETLSYAELLRLKKGADCYVSLHRSEGWGFGLIEAMMLEVPLVCTGYSGNMEFCSAETAFLVDYDLVSPRADDYIFVGEGQVWADPKLDSAVEQLRRVRAQPDEAARRSAAALAYVQTTFAPDVISKRYGDRIGTILARLSDERQ